MAARRGTEVVAVFCGAFVLTSTPVIHCSRGRGGPALERTNPSLAKTRLVKAIRERVPESEAG